MGGGQIAAERGIQYVRKFQLTYKKLTYENHC